MSHTSPAGGPRRKWAPDYPRRTLALALVLYCLGLARTISQTGGILGGEILGGGRLWSPVVYVGGGLLLAVALLRRDGRAELAVRAAAATVLVPAFLYRAVVAATAIIEDGGAFDADRFYRAGGAASLLTAAFTITLLAYWRELRR